MIDPWGQYRSSANATAYVQRQVPSLFTSNLEPENPRDLRLVRVAVNRGIDRSGDLRESLLTYTLPVGIDAQPGQLVKVPLGRANSAASAVAIEVGGFELLGDLPVEKLKGISSVTPAILPRSLLELAKWMAQYYVCPLGMVLQAVLPAAVKRQVGRTLVTRFTLAPDLDSRVAALGKLPKRQLDAIAALRTLPAERWPARAKSLHAESGVSAAMQKKLVALRVLTALITDEVTASGELLGAFPSGPSVGAPARPVPTPEQAVAIDALERALGSFSAHLLLGVTGSGKTEVYLRVIETMLARHAHASAIVLVPEIALTPQTSSRFIERFGATVAVLHSGLSASQRNAQWALAATGRVRVVVGARSAIFAPVAKLGIVIVDEEHDSSYKQDQLPRYHARDVAVKRASIEGCPVVMGSATPSLESYANAIGPDHRYALWKLPTRANGARMPRVEIVDLVSERALRSQLHPGQWRTRQLHLLGPTLEIAIDQTLAAGGQAILLLNRRGYANYLCCPSPTCGWIMRCDHCDASSVLHMHQDVRAQSAGFVRCHHCLAEQLLPKRCPVCAKEINTFGLGTQRVEEELQRKFLHTRNLKLGETLLRADSDTMSTAKDYFDALSRFARGEIRVLLGTQMIAKGLDFPNVRLVGVVHADTALNLPDFRAAERTFQLVAQVAGRAGRGSHPGRVIVQTMNPREPSIVMAAQHDFEGFASRELAIRRASRLPPSEKMARIVCRDLELAKATGHAAALSAEITRLAPAIAGLRVRGPMPCPISRIADHHRIAIELTAPTRGTLQHLLAQLRSAGLLISDAHTAIDVDPVSLM